MEIIQTILTKMADLIWATPQFFPMMIVILLTAGFIITIRTRAIQIRQFLHGWKVMIGLYDNPDDEGDISHFQAISAVLSATVGIGNIAGVATAIHYGGPGALFWMWITAILGMSLKFAEATLAIKYRQINPDGSVSGGPMYYIEKGLGPKFKWMAITFAAMVVISSLATGNTIQSFTVADQFRSMFSIPTWITGLVTSTLIGLVIIGGIKRIGKVASILAPGMCILYIIAGLLILGLNFQELPNAFATIFRSAFTKNAGIGGFAGSTFLFMMMWGIKRGLFSNEAGQGSAPIAHAAAKTNEPAREGIVAMLGPFIDTLMVCSITGLVIVVTGVWHQKSDSTIIANSQASISITDQSGKVGIDSNIKGNLLKNSVFEVENGIGKNVIFIKNHSVIDNPEIIVQDKPYSGKILINESGNMILENSDLPIYIHGMIMKNSSPLTAWAFEKGLSPIMPGGKYLITIAVFLFAISTAISWSYYGGRGAYYLFGENGANYYKWFFVLAHFIGAIVSLEIVWGFGDVAIGLMAIPNLIALVALSGIIKKIGDEYTSRKHLTYKEQLRKKGLI